ncbi:MerR family transcriptional regulator, partial [Nocardia sp. NPDC005978]|uniref:MerR family transcriptional regulator n=1 Tax=Nocardia sp. NPDC005978 TaxID=3156725 RepID=UPI0033B30D34
RPSPLCPGRSSRELFLRPIPRTPGGQRSFDSFDVEWLLLCNRLRQSGMPIARLKEFARLVRSGPGNERQRLELLESHERAVRDRIDQLTESLEIIRGKVAVYREHVEEGTAAGIWSPTPFPGTLGEGRDDTGGQR